MAGFTGTVYKWQGFGPKINGLKGRLEDDDEALDWINGDESGDQVLDVDGTNYSVSGGGTLKTDFTNSNGDTFTEDLVFFSTSDGWYFTPLKGTNLDEGSTLKKFTTGRWNDTDGVQYDQMLCYAPDSLIKTDQGWEKVQNLTTNSRIATIDQGYQPLLWIAESRFDPLDALRRQITPVTIKAGAFGKGLPFADLTVSPQHRFAISGVDLSLNFGLDACLAPAKGMIGAPGIHATNPIAPVRFIHLLLPAHELIMANGLASESLFPGGVAIGAMSKPNQQCLSSILANHPPYRLARPALSVCETRSLVAGRFTLVA